MKEKERERDFKDYISNNILIDKELTHNEKRNLNNEAWQLKQEAIKAKQELEFSQRLEKIEKNIEYKSSKTVYKSTHGLKAVNKDLFTAHASKLNHKANNKTMSQSMHSLNTRADFEETRGTIESEGYKDNLKGMTNAMLEAEKEKLFRRLKM